MIIRHCVEIRTQVTGTRVHGVTGVPPSCIEQAELASCSSAPVKVSAAPVAGLGLDTLDTGDIWQHLQPGHRHYANLEPQLFSLTWK